MRGGHPQRRAGELFREPNFAVTTTLKTDGTPETSVVWVDEENGRPVFNTTNARAKARHLRRDPRVSVLVWDRADPYRYIEVEGIAELDQDGASERINKVSHKYRGTDFPHPQNRVIVRVNPSRIFDYLDGPPPDPLSSDTWTSRTRPFDRKGGTAWPAATTTRSSWSNSLSGAR